MGIVVFDVITLVIQKDAAGFLVEIGGKTGADRCRQASRGSDVVIHVKEGSACFTRVAAEVEMRLESI